MAICLSFSYDDSLFYVDEGDAILVTRVWGSPYPIKVGDICHIQGGFIVNPDGKAFTKALGEGSWGTWVAVPYQGKEVTEGDIV